MELLKRELEEKMAEVMRVKATLQSSETVRCLAKSAPFRVISSAAEAQDFSEWIFPSFTHGHLPLLAFLAALYFFSFFLCRLTRHRWK